MNARQRHALLIRETDVDGALRRLGGDEAVYTLCLREFLNDQTMAELNRSIEACAWDEAFTAAHALKGVAGNMGFVPLMHQVGQLIVLIRGGRTREIDESLLLCNSAYRDLTDAIRQFLRYADD